MAYTTIPKSSDYFNTLLYTGTGAENAQTGVGFQPDLTWLKRRNGIGSHRLFDAVRGATKEIFADATLAESTDAQSLKSFDSDGFTLGTGGATNGSGNTYANWNWLANGAGSANTVGDIASTVSANTTSGFSVVSYTGNNASGATVGHGLSSAPKMVIGKAITSSGEDWFVGHSSIGFDKYLKLNTTDAANTTSVIFNNTAPSNSVVTLGNNGAVNSASYNYIMYCFADVQGYSKFGSYTGNGSTDGPFVYTGFKPAFVITKRTDSGGSWGMNDNKRPNYNPENLYLIANDAQAEASDGSWTMDLLSNGWKARYNNGNFNAVGGSYIYMAFASAPLVGTNNIPANAR